MRKAEANTPVVSLDHLVAGVTGGDQKTAAADDGVLYMLESEGEKEDGEVLEDQRLTRNPSVLPVRPGEVGGAPNRR
jgi:hypothetical protein